MLYDSVIRYCDYILHTDEGSILPSLPIIERIEKSLKSSWMCIYWLNEKRFSNSELYSVLTLFLYLCT